MLQYRLWHNSSNSHEKFDVWLRIPSDIPGETEDAGSPVLHPLFGCLPLSLACSFRNSFLRCLTLINLPSNCFIWYRDDANYRDPDSGHHPDIRWNSYLGLIWYWSGADFQVDTAYYPWLTICFLWYWTFAAVQSTGDAQQQRKHIALISSKNPSVSSNIG